MRNLLIKLFGRWHLGIDQIDDLVMGPYFFHLQHVYFFNILFRPWAPFYLRVHIFFTREQLLREYQELHRRDGRYAPAQIEWRYPSVEISRARFRSQYDSGRKGPRG